MTVFFLLLFFAIFLCCWFFWYCVNPPFWAGLPVARALVNIIQVCCVFYVMFWCIFFVFIARFGWCQLCFCVDRISVLLFWMFLCVFFGVFLCSFLLPLLFNVFASVLCPSVTFSSHYWFSFLLVWCGSCHAGIFLCLACLKSIVFPAHWGTYMSSFCAPS